MGDVLSDTPGVLYWDEVHHDELANRVIAEAMYPHLQAQFAELARNT